MSVRSVVVAGLTLIGVTVAVVLGSAAVPAVHQRDLPVPTTKDALPVAATESQAVAQARALTDAGRTKEADAVLQAWIAKHPAFTPPADLRASTSAPAPLPRWQNAVLPWLLAAVLLIAAALAIWWLARLLVLLTLRAWGGLGAFVAAVADRTPPGALRLVSIEGSGADDATRHALGSVLIAHSRRLSDQKAGGPRGVRVQRPLDQAAVKLPDEVVMAYAPAGALAAILGLLIRLIPDGSRPITLELLPADAANGLGVEVTLDGQSATIREAHFAQLPAGLAPTSDDRRLSRYQSLMLPAAVWLAYTARPGEPQYGTARWSSYAHAVVGAGMHLHGDLEAAEQRYRTALEQDHHNEMARYNLASVLLQPRRGERPADHALAADRLALMRELLAGLCRQLTDHLGSPARAHEVPGALEVSAAYLDAIRCLYLDDLHTAAKRLGELDQALEIPPPPVGSRTADPLAAIRSTIRPTIELLSCTVRMLSTGLLVDPPQLDAESRWIPDVHYGYACFYARRARFQEAEAEPDRARALTHLRAALGTGDPLLRRSAETDPAFAALRTGATAKAFAALVAGTASVTAGSAPVLAAH